MPPLNGNKTIFKNTIMLYIRMFVKIAINLYTARVVLQILGTEDFGINGVVCGVLTMFTFLNSSMSGATSRFLTFQLGRDEFKKLQTTFSTSLIIHAIIALIIAFLCESIGLWFLNNRLIIPIDRLPAANWVFQFSILSMFVSVTQVPYNASIFSHERMDVYAIVEIVQSVLKLLIVFILLIGKCDKLIEYAILNFIITLLIALFYRFYCIRHFAECKFKFIWDKILFKNMLSFSVWDLFGQLSVMARTQGVNMLLNLFFGPIMNAATEIATKIQAIVMNLSTNVSIASRPQIVINYSQDNHKKMIILMRDSARLTFVLMSLFSIPLMVEHHYVLTLWLGNVPPNTETICILTLLWNIVVSMNITTGYAVQATAKVKRVSLISGTLYLMVIPLTYICLSKGMNYWIPFAYNVCAVIIAPFLGSGPTLKKHLKGYSICGIMLQDITRDWSALIISTGITCMIPFLLKESFIRLCLTTTVSSIMVLLTAYLIVFPSDRRKIITQKILEKIWKKNH